MTEDNKILKHILSPKDYKSIFLELCSFYPMLFNKEKVLLMKKGIFQDLIKGSTLSCKKTSLSKFFKVYTDKKTYQDKCRLRIAYFVLL